VRTSRNNSKKLNPVKFALQLFNRDKLLNCHYSIIKDLSKK